MDEKLSPEQALIYAMITMSAVDGNMRDTELRRIGTMVQELPPFRAFDSEDLITEAKGCQRVVSGPDGLERVLQLIDDGLPAHLRETAYVLATEVAVSDHAIRAEERRLLDLLARQLRIDALTAAALERGANARHRSIGEH
ncbi:MAG: tellurite resistance TerB family protein [Pseudomonadota bacterium]